MRRARLLWILSALSIVATGLFVSGPSGVAVAASKHSKKQPIRIGTIIPGSVTGGLSSYTTTVAVPNAWVDWTNAHGGIDGHKVKLYEMTDGNNPAKALTDVNTLIQSDKVVALVGNNDSVVDGTYAQHLQSLGVPNIGGADFEQAWQTNPDYFPTFATITPKAYADIYAAKSIKAKSIVAAYCATDPACIADVQQQKKQAPKLGIKYTIGPSAAFTAPNYTAQCEVMGADHPDAFYFSSGPTGIEEMAKNCTQQGFNQEWILPNPVPSQLTAPGLEKAAIGQDLQLPYFSDYHLHQYKKYVAALKKYEPKAKFAKFPDAIRQWGAYDVFKKALELEKGKSITPKTVKKGLYSLKGFNDHGLLQHLTYKPGKPTENKCFVIWGIKNGKFVFPDGHKYKCMP